MQFYIDSFDNINIDKLYYWKHWFIHLNIISWKEWKTSFLRWIVLGITVNSPNGWMEGPLKGEARVVLSHSRMLSVLHWNSTNHKTFPPVECWPSFISTLQGSIHGPTLWFNCTVKDDWLSPSDSTDLNTYYLIFLLIFSTVIPLVRLSY